MSSNCVPPMCEKCPYSQPSAMMELLTFAQEKARAGAAQHIDEGEDMDKKLSRMFAHLTIAVFDGPDFRIEEKTALAIIRCFKSIWNTGNRELTCARYPMLESHKHPGAPVLCSRKYMMEETIAFLKALWKEAEGDDKIFQELLEVRFLELELDFQLV